tara:strand:- start:662 stop:925 length:264 start_codon:yes stop_codon:yes gene_type:complete
MLDPVDVESIIKAVFKEDGTLTDIVFNGIDIQPEKDYTTYIYDFTIIYFNINDRTKIEYHMEKLQESVINTNLIGEPCDIVLDLTVA